MSEVILIEKVGTDWFYLYREELYDVGSIDGDLHKQFTVLISYIFELHGFTEQSDVVVCSNVLVETVITALRVRYQAADFVAVRTPDVLRAFQRAFRDVRNARNSRQTGRNADTLYVCSDGSYSPVAGLSGWAWVSSDTGENSYNFGVIAQNSTILVELEGILRAIVENRKHEATKLHIYCDSQQSVAHAKTILGSYRKWDTEFMDSLNKRTRMLAQVAHETAAEKTVTVEWVKGHANHRLNIGADFLSREVWQRAHNGQRLLSNDPHVISALKLIRR